MKAEKNGWAKDEGYSGCETKRFGRIAVVICPPEYGGYWGYQAFDEGDERAIERGDIFAEDYGYASEESVIAYVEECMQQ